MNIKDKNKLNEMLKEGFSKKFAISYLRTIERENKLQLYSKEYINWAHNNGFFSFHAAQYNLNDKNKYNYLSDYDYYKIWPLNNWSKIWIDDKLTLKYALYGSQFSHLMPKYYFYTTEKNLLPLMDANDLNKNNLNGLDLFFYILQLVKVFACKPNNGTGSNGFVKLSYKNSQYFINNKKISKKDIVNFVKNKSNYLYTEYITPNNFFKQFSSQIHTLRVAIKNESGNDPKIMFSFIRFPNSTTGFANYSELENGGSKSYNIFTCINSSTGFFEKSIKSSITGVKLITNHPDNNIPLNGQIPNFKELKKSIYGVAKYLNNLEYMGLDIGITNNGFKIMEINSHPAICTPQIFNPFFKNPVTGNYFKNKIQLTNSSLLNF